MIECYTGTPGSGKSYHAAYDMFNRIKYKHPVITNIPLSLGKLESKPWYRETYIFIEQDVISSKDFCNYLKEFSNNLRDLRGWSRVPEDYIYLVIDEAQLIFNCRDWQASGRKEWTSFFQQHRKYGYHVILITQMSKMLDKHIQGLLEYEIIHRKFSNFGIKGIILSLFFFSPSMFAAIRMWSAMRERIDCKIFRFSKRIAKIYNTTTDFSPDK